MDPQSRNKAPGAHWSLSDGYPERLETDGIKSDYTIFYFCGIYCAVAVFFLCVFCIAALMRQEYVYAYTILGFALTTVVGYAAIWWSGQLNLASHFVVLLMASLCLYLFYSGGTEATGPIFYFIFPLVALFLQGSLLGAISSVSLLLFTIVVYFSGIFGFDQTLYEFTFFIRVVTVYIIVSMLAYIFCHFRDKAEREALISSEDLRQFSLADPVRGLVSANLTEKLIQGESLRFQQYHRPCTLMLMEIDDFTVLKFRFGHHSSVRVLEILVSILGKILRVTDTPGRWRDDQILVVLPETDIDGAFALVKRLLSQIENHVFSLHGREVEISVTIGIDQIDQSEASLVLENLELALEKARQSGQKCSTPHRSLE